MNRRKVRLAKIVPIAIAFTFCFLVAASADVTISTAATSNMNCSGGVCAPTAADAVLNVGDLVTLLASGNVTVTTTGAAIEANDLVVASALAWSTSSALTLQAYRSLLIDEPISVAGLSNLTLTAATGGPPGALAFASGGYVTFANLASSVTIDGTTFVLVGDLKSLATAIAANPSGNFALADSYDASPDGTYAGAPVSTTYTGAFEGLNNTISNLAISDSVAADSVGLFATLGTAGTIADINLVGVRIATLGKGIIAGAIVGTNQGIVGPCSASGKIRAEHIGTGGANQVGGVAGWNANTIGNCRAAVSITAGRNSGSGFFGGLAGSNSDWVIYSSASGDVHVGNHAYAGGLIGWNGGFVELNYAKGDVTGGADVQAGGLVGGNGQQGFVATNYAAGNVSVAGFGKYPSIAGGLFGWAFSWGTSEDYSTGSPLGSDSDFVGGSVGYSYDGLDQYVYWDTTTSGTKRGAGGGTPEANGLTNRQLKSGLPAGFETYFWGQETGVNKGWPFLLSNPPK